ncbi:MAG: MFS transporter [Proteobacteria bacterium]|nr:MFS transporter [Pseudomonadota bacterium]MBI3496813.1 MFS transporter [Pseudomonadota bacterium]
MPLPTRLKPILSALSHPNYRVYASGNSISLIGTWMQRIAVGWVTWQLTQSGAWLGLMSFAEFFPSTFVAPIAGAVVDRHDGLSVSRLTQGLLMAQASTLAVLAFTGTLTIWYLLALTAFQGVVTAFNQPARLSIIANLVPRADLPVAVAINSITFNTARFLGPSAAGLAIVAAGPAWAFACNAVMFLAFLTSLWRIRIPRSVHAKPATGGLLSDIGAGYAYAARHRGIGPILLLLMVGSIGARPVVELLPGFAGAIYGRGADGLAMLTASVGVGAVIGGLWLAQRGHIKGLTRLSITSGAAVAASALLFSVTDWFWLGVATLGFSGAAMTMNGVAAQTLVQSAVAPAMRGRVLSLYGMVFRSGPAVGALIMGVASEWIGLRWPLALGAMLVLATYAWSFRNLTGMATALEGSERIGTAD